RQNRSIDSPRILTLKILKQWAFSIIGPVHTIKVSESFLKFFNFQRLPTLIISDYSCEIKKLIIMNKSIFLSLILLHCSIFLSYSQFQNGDKIDPKTKKALTLSHYSGTPDVNESEIPIDITDGYLTIYATCFETYDENIIYTEDRYFQLNFTFYDQNGNQLPIGQTYIGHFNGLLPDVSIEKIESKECLDCPQRLTWEQITWKSNINLLRDNHILSNMTCEELHSLSVRMNLTIQTSLSRYFPSNHTSCHERFPNVCLKEVNDQVSYEAYMRCSNNGDLKKAHINSHVHSTKPTSDFVQNSNSNKQVVFLYPNPTRGNVSCPILIKQYSIESICGKTVDMNKNLNSNLLDLSNIPPGHYFIYLITTLGEDRIPLIKVP
ncbi:MAG: T9SS type A sorting domain-containing protein, partial [Saprospiraceae bacterium]|nr:T9SS type A sorting domain-containing protein [Saprospiraceae bacterium]